jgi:hypothetical protein
VGLLLKCLPMALAVWLSIEELPPGPSPPVARKRNVHRERNQECPGGF